MPDATRRIGRERVGALALVALVASLTPIAIDRSGAVDNPFLFASAWHIAGGMAALAYLGARYRPLFTVPVLNEVFHWRTERQLSLGRTSLAPSATVVLVVAALIFGHSDLLFLVWSIRLTDVAVATILYEIWPFVVYASAVLSFMTGRRVSVSGTGDGENTVTERIAELSILSMGLIFVAASHLGATSSVVGMAFGAMSSIAWGTQYALISKLLSGITVDPIMGIMREDVQLFGTLLISSIITLVSGLIFVGIALVVSEQMSGSVAVAIAASITITIIVRPVMRRTASEVPQTWADALLLVILTGPPSRVHRL